MEGSQRTMLIRLGPLFQLADIFVKIPSSAIALLQTPLLKIGVVPLEQFFVGGTDVLNECWATDTDDDAAKTR